MTKRTRCLATISHGAESYQCNRPKDHKPLQHLAKAKTGRLVKWTDRPPERPLFLNPGRLGSKTPADQQLPRHPAGHLLAEDDAQRARSRDKQRNFAANYGRLEGEGPPPDRTAARALEAVLSTGRGPADPPPDYAALEQRVLALETFTRSQAMQTVFGLNYGPDRPERDQLLHTLRTATAKARFKLALDYDLKAGQLFELTVHGLPTDPRHLAALRVTTSPTPLPATPPQAPSTPTPTDPTKVTATDTPRAKGFRKRGRAPKKDSAK